MPPRDDTRTEMKRMAAAAMGAMVLAYPAFADPFSLTAFGHRLEIRSPSFGAQFFTAGDQGELDEVLWISGQEVHRNDLLPLVR